MVRLLPMLGPAMRFLDRPVSRDRPRAPGSFVRVAALVWTSVTLAAVAGSSRAQTPTDKSVPTAELTPTPSPAPSATPAPAAPSSPTPTSKPARPLALADAEARALEHQPAIAQAHGQTEAAEGRVEEARAGYLPQVTATGLYERTTGNFAPRPGSLPTTAASVSWNSNLYNYFNFGAQGSQLIYDFGQTDGRWRAAGANRDAAKSGERTTRSQTLLNVRRAYFQARAGKDLTGVAEDSVNNQQKHLRQIQEFVRAGMRPEIDLAQARTDLANATVQLVTAQNNYAEALVVLEQTMGSPIGTGLEPTDTEMAPVPGEGDAPDRLVADAERARPDLATLDEQRRAQALTVRAIEGGYGPSLNAVAAATETGSELDRLVPNWYLGLSVTWPILQGGLTRGQAREANGTLIALGASADALRLQVRVDVEQARLGVTAAKSTISAAEDAVVNAREQLRLAERRYETGLGSAIELGDAQVAATTAAAQEVGARTNLALARALLLNALGAP